MNTDNCLQVLPGISSVASKVLASEIKSSTKVKVEFAELWLEIMILRMFKDKKLGNKRENLVKKTQFDIRDMFKMSLSPTSEVK